MLGHVRTVPTLLTWWPVVEGAGPFQESRRRGFTLCRRGKAGEEGKRRFGARNQECGRFKSGHPLGTLFEKTRELKSQRHQERERCEEKSGAPELKPRVNCRAPHHMVQRQA